MRACLKKALIGLLSTGTWTGWSGLRLCCSHATKSGFIALRLNIIMITLNTHSRYT